MAPPTLPPSHGTTQRPPLQLETLTPLSFSPFGTAILSPLPPSLTVPPSSSSQIPQALYPTHQPLASLANQNSALKTNPISQCMNNYSTSSSPDTVKPQMSMFSCFPRNISGIGMSSSPTTEEKVFKVDILERHPHTSQTFCPFVAPREVGESAFVVIVAPSLPNTIFATNLNGSVTMIENSPDLAGLRAFKAYPGQAVTYAPGTWHAPMVVLGKQRIDFLVVQFVNGVDQDDCQEVLLGDGARCVEIQGLLSEIGNAGNRGTKSRL
jgi:ureidoglycolate lyase